MATQKTHVSEEERIDFSMDVNRLLLDPENPRLHVPPKSSQKILLQQLFEEHRLEELMESLLTNGYFTEEPLVAVPGKKSGTYIVVEGNRRLAALKLLIGEDISAELRIRNMPRGTKEQLASLRHVPVKIYPSRKEVLPYLGFRHITGIKEWDAESKARYVYQLREEGKIELDEIAKMIGDTYKMTDRLYLGWSLIKQAEETVGFTQKETYKFPFSYMYDAVRMPEVKAFLGLKEGKYTVASKDTDKLRELVDWLFGNKPHRKQPVVARKGQLKELAYTVADAEGVKALRAGADLDEAYQLTRGEHDQLIEWLSKASKDLDRSKGILHRHSDARDVGDLVVQCSQTISAMMSELGK